MADGSESRAQQKTYKPRKVRRGREWGGRQQKVLADIYDAPKIKSKVKCVLQELFATWRKSMTNLEMFLR